MDRSGYLEAAAQRFTEFGGFAPVEGEALPAAVAEWADLVLERVEPGLITWVAFLPLRAGSLLPGVRGEMAAHLTAMRPEAKAERLGVLLLVTEEPLTREEYDRLQGLVHQAGRVRLVPWVADLARGRLFGHQGPPFGIDPDLYMLASPEAEQATRSLAARRAAPAGWVPWLTVGIAVILVAVWVAMTVAGRSLRATEDAELLYRWGAALRPDLLQRGEYWRLFTAGFLHIGPAHLFMNTLSLWWIGQLVERLYGRLRMAVIYLVALVAGSVGSVIFGPPLILSAGASGAIFGLLGAVLWYRLAAPRRQRLQQTPIFLVVLFSLLSGVLLQENVDNWNHLAGLVGGVVAAAAVGFVEQTGPRLARTLLHGLSTFALLALSGAVVLGMFELPGPSQHLARSLNAYEARRLDEAQREMERVVAADPEQPYLHFMLAWIYYEQGRLSDARSRLDQVFRLEPNHPGAQDLLHRLQPPVETKEQFRRR
ncbi:MAG: rhomboid family intramembrane serine protease [Bacillota bacterium]